MHTNTFLTHLFIYFSSRTWLGTQVGNYKISTPSFLSNFTSISPPFRAPYLLISASPLPSHCAFLVSSARVSHLSLASPPLTGGTCPQVPLRISQLLFKSISMLNSCWRVWVGGGVGPVVQAAMEEERLRHYNEPQLFHTADPRGRSTAPVLFSVSLSLKLPPLTPPSLPWFGLLSLCVLPFGFSLSFYFHPCPSLFFFFFLFLFLSLTSILPARPRACSHFR